jgi:hypothetical protein
VEQVRKARTLSTSPKHDDQEEEIIIRTLSGDPPVTNEPACINAHSIMTDTLDITESNHTMDSNGAIDVNEEIPDNRNPGNVVCIDSDQADQAPDLPVAPFVPTVSLPLNPPPTMPYVPLVFPPGPPLAPGSPSSPIENVFARLATAAASLLINNPPVSGEESIDPILLDMVNHAPPTNYHLPGAVVGHTTNRIPGT